MVIINVKPTINKRLVVICALLGGVRGLGVMRGERRAIGKRIPRLIGTNEMQGGNFGTVAFICRGVPITRVRYVEKEETLVRTYTPLLGWYYR
jgi:hypothetical protein